MLAVEPLTLLMALRLAQKARRRRCGPATLTAKADKAKAAEWAETWRRNWERRFMKG